MAATKGELTVNDSREITEELEEILFNTQPSDLNHQPFPEGRQT